MVVDDSVIVIDGYSELLEKGHSRWYAAAVSTRDLFVPMLIATTSISGMFFPMLGLMTGPLADFIKLFLGALGYPCRGTMLLQFHQHYQAVHGSQGLSL